MAGEPVLFIVNPASGGGKTARDWAAIESWLPSTGLRFETAFTTRQMEAVDIAKNAVRQSRPVVVAVGGDGTLNEVVNGFFHNGAPIPTASRMAWCRSARAVTFGGRFGSRSTRGRRFNSSPRDCLGGSMLAA